jgi:hypothetical protein
MLLLLLLLPRPPPKTSSSIANSQMHTPYTTSRDADSKTKPAARMNI